MSSPYRQQAPRETPESGVTPLLASGALVLLCCFSGLWFPHLCHQDGRVNFYRLVQLQAPWSGAGTLGQDLGLRPGLLENRHPGSATTHGLTLQGGHKCHCWSVLLPPRGSEMALNKMGSKCASFLSCASVGGRIRMPPPPEGVHILLPRTCEQVKLRGKGIKNAGGMKVARRLTWRCRDYPGLSTCPA